MGYKQHEELCCVVRQNCSPFSFSYVNAAATVCCIWMAYTWHSLQTPWKQPAVLQLPGQLITTEITLTAGVRVDIHVTYSSLSLRSSQNPKAGYKVRGTTVLCFYKQDSRKASNVEGHHPPSHPCREGNGAAHSSAHRCWHLHWQREDRNLPPLLHSGGGTPASPKQEQRLGGGSTSPRGRQWLATKWLLVHFSWGAAVLQLPAAVKQRLSAWWSSHLSITNEKWSQREDLRSKTKDWDKDSRVGKPCFHRSPLQDISSIVFVTFSLSFLRREMLGVLLLPLITNFSPYWLISTIFYRKLTPLRLYQQSLSPGWKK